MDLEHLQHRPTLAGTTWTIRVRRSDQAGMPRELEPNLLLQTASVGKLFLLVEVADAIHAGALDPQQSVPRRATAPVRDSGLWQHLTTDELPVADLAMLVGSVSDNWATNALIETVGLERVQARAASLVSGGSMLLDLVRDQRTASTPETLSRGTAADLEGLMARLCSGDVVSSVVSSTVLYWLSASADLSMVAAAFGLDPLSHASADRGVRVWNKTGTDDGVRADVGIVEIAGVTTTYAVVCNWDPQSCGPATRDAVLETMKEIGQHVRASVEG